MNLIYEKEVWNQYAMEFLVIQPSKMLELNKAVADLAYGDVCDFGCGAAKIAPFILGNLKVDSYTGIDSSPEMVKLARWHVKQFPEKPSEIIQDKLEKVSPKPYDIKKVGGTKIYKRKSGFDFGLSINSYYVWYSPEVVLKRISSTLKPNGMFVLVTPNHKLDMESMLPEARRELVANPYFKSFVEQNRSISENTEARLIDMDSLVAQVRKLGFKVIEANQQFYDGGLNFLILTT